MLSAPFRRALCLALPAAALLWPMGASARIEVRDDSGQTIALAQPAARIASLAPHVTELLFAAGAGNRVVAADEFSDFPEAAKAIPRIGSAYALDLESLLALKPDLVIAWKSGNDARQVARIRELGIPVFLSEPRTPGDIARALEIFGRLAGTESTSGPAARKLRAQIGELESKYRGRSRVKVFFEIWSPPVMTVNSSHLIDAALNLCGADNVFGQLSSLTPTVSIESVVAAAPEVILASGMGNARPSFLDDWARWPRMPAVQNGLVAHIPADLITRPGPRLIEGAAQACAIIQRARMISSGGNKQP
jgi:iron complex transport system substrate-binding protein